MCHTCYQTNKGEPSKNPYKITNKDLPADTMLALLSRITPKQLAAVQDLMKWHKKKDKNKDGAVTGLDLYYLNKKLDEPLFVNSQGNPMTVKEVRHMLLLLIVRTSSPNAERFPIVDHRERRCQQ